MNKVLIYREMLLVFSLLLILSCADDELPPEPINNEYELDGVVFEIRTQMYWQVEGGQGAIDQIRLNEPIPGSDLSDMIVLSPIPGPSAIEGTYVYSRTSDIGTYDLVFLHATDGVDQLQWYTNGDSGAELVIQSMGKKEGQEVYRILLDNFVLNYGYWDFLAGQWVSSGNKSFRLSYEGPIQF